MPIDRKDVSSLGEIQEIVDTHLTALRFFPAGAGSVAVARLVAELVDSVDQACQLCRAIVEDWDEWPGPASLRGKFLELFRKDQLYGNPPRLKPEPVQCALCQDWGRIRGPGGKWTACQCTPDFPAEVLEALNRPPRPTLTPDQLRRTHLIAAGDILAINELLARSEPSAEA